MENKNTEQQLQKMISIINQIPTGLVEMDMDGNILQMNAKGVQLLMPMFMMLQLSGSNIYELLNIIAPVIVKKIKKFEPTSGTIVQQENHKVEMQLGGQNMVRYFYYTINKIDANTISFVFDDITDLQEKENQISEAVKEKAIEQSKFEMASGILHDIGNAVVGFGSYTNRIKQHLTQSDYNNLNSLHGFLEKNKQQFDSAIGEVKTKAMMDMIAGIAENQQKNASAANVIISEQMGIINHISEILSIQRQYIKGQQSSDREKVNIRSVINDSIAMILSELTKNDIEIQMDIPIDLPAVKGDKTRLMQVFLNLFKNALESISSFEHHNKQIKVAITRNEQVVAVYITDSGIGFDKETAEKIFSRGFTSKESGTGLGLLNCRSIVESHHGTLELKSDGLEKGSTAIVTLKI